jgi:hypothetical protein
MWRGFHVNLSFSGSLVLKNKFFNDRTLYLHFFHYLPYDENLVLWIPFMQGSINFDWNWPDGFGEDFSQYKL